MMTDIEEESAVAEVQSTEKSKDSELSIDFSNPSKQLAKIFISIFYKPIENVKQELINLETKQETCITRMQIENQNLCHILEDVELNDMFSTLQIYHKKLVNIRKEIILTHDRIFKLKKRAQRFQQIKQKEIVHKDQQHGQDVEEKNT